MSVGAPGQLYLKIVDGSEDIKGKPLHCSMGIIGAKIKLKTKPNKIRYWNEEATFGVHDKLSCTLLVSVKEPKLGQNKNRGSISLNLSELPDYNPTEMWLDLNGGSGKIHIICIFTPFLIQGNVEALTKRMPSFRVHLERTTYFPGETICGHIVWNVSKVRKIRAVRIKFTGSAKTKWSEQEGSGDNRRTVYYYAVVNYFNSVATVWGAPKGVKKNHEITPGTYSWPFTFTMPVDLAPSINGTYGKIKYNVQAYVDIPMAIDKKITVPLEVCIQYGNMGLPPLLKISGSTKGGIIKKKQNIEVSAVCNDILYIGRPQEVPVTVTNLSSKAVKKLEVELQSKIRFYARRSGVGHWHKRVQNSQGFFNRIDGPGDVLLAPGETWNSVISLTVPEGFRPTVTPALCPILTHEYRLKLAAVTKGNTFTKGKSKVKFGVSVGWIHPMLEMMQIYEPQPAFAPVNQIGLFQQEITTEWYAQFAPQPSYAQSEDYYIGNHFDRSAFNNVQYGEQWTEFEDQVTDNGGLESFNTTQYETYQPQQNNQQPPPNIQNVTPQLQHHGSQGNMQPQQGYGTPPNSPQLQHHGSQGNMQPQQGQYPPQQGYGTPPNSPQIQHHGSQGNMQPQQGYGTPPNSPQLQHHGSQGNMQPQQGQYPPQQGQYPPQQGQYPPQQGQYPTQQGDQQGQYPPQQYQPQANTMPMPSD